MGLASFTLISAAWSYELCAWILSWSRMNWPGFQNFAWFAAHIEIYVTVVAPPLALALKGLPRLQLFTAGILLNVLMGSFHYV
jgi:hypothetical protein